MVTHKDYPVYLQRRPGLATHLARPVTPETFLTLCQRRIASDSCALLAGAEDRICVRCLRRIPQPRLVLKGAR
jgi:hypothetical protein